MDKHFKKINKENFETELKYQRTEQTLGNIHHKIFQFNLDSKQKENTKKKKRTSVSNFQQFENFAFIFLQKSINLDELHLLISQLAFGKKKINLYFCHCWKQLFCNLYCVLISNRFLLKSAIFFSAEQMFLPHQKKKKYIILFVHSEYR